MVGLSVLVRAPRGLPGPGFRLPWPAGGQVGWPSRWGHFLGPGGRTAARVPFPRVRSRPLCRGVAKSGPHDPGEYPVRSVRRSIGRRTPETKEEKNRRAPSTRVRVDLELISDRGIEKPNGPFPGPRGSLRRRDRLPAPKGPRGTSVRLREQEDGPVATSRAAAGRLFRARQAGKLGLPRDGSFGQSLSCWARLAGPSFLSTPREESSRRSPLAAELGAFACQDR